MTTFKDLGLQENLVNAITELGFTTPTEIQEKAIPLFLERRSDLIALAQTGTGKTAAFGLPIIQNTDTSNPSTQALIISPTRELCMQITSDLKNYSKYHRGVRITAVYGGSSIMAQIRELKQGVHIIVATPGRLLDLINRKAVKLDQVKTVVLDEADEMLNMGFQEDMEAILAHTPEDKNTGLFSATMSREIRNIANQYLKQTEEVAAGKKNTAGQDITHQYAVVQAKDKLPALKRIIDFNQNFFGIIFCTTRIETQEISDALIKAGYNSDCLHGDLSQQQRDKVMGKFRKRVVRILCATDVAARGIDVNDITHVIHYHLPDDIENYTHRSGRTARAGKKGISIVLLHIREAFKLHNIERTAGLKFEKFLIPTGHEIIGKRISSYISDFMDSDYETKTNISLDNQWVSQLMDMEKEELVNRILKKELAKIDNDYTLHEDLNVSEHLKNGRRVETRESNYSRERGNDRYERNDRNDRNDRSDRGGRREFSPSNDGGTRLFINLGKKDNIRYDEIRNMIFQQSKVSGHYIKDIEMKGAYSFFQTDEKSADRILQAFQNVELKGRDVRIQRAEGQKEEGFNKNFWDTKEYTAVKEEKKYEAVKAPAKFPRTRFKK